MNRLLNRLVVVACLLAGCASAESARPAQPAPPRETYPTIDPDTLPWSDPPTIAQAPTLAPLTDDEWTPTATPRPQSRCGSSPESWLEIQVPMGIHRYVFTSKPCRDKGTLTLMVRHELFDVRFKCTTDIHFASQVDEGALSENFGPEGGGDATRPTCFNMVIIYHACCENAYATLNAYYNSLEWEVSK